MHCMTLNDSETSNVEAYEKMSKKMTILQGDQGIKIVYFLLITDFVILVLLGIFINIIVLTRF